MPDSSGRAIVTALNAQLVPGGTSGGIEQFVAGLVRALGRLDDGDDEYLIVTAREAPDWLAEEIGPNQRLVPFDAAAARRLPILQRLARRLRRSLSAAPTAAFFAEPFFDAVGADVVHFPYQWYRRCGVPTIFNPHDLQHLHYPEFFTRDELAARSRRYPTACREATFVASESNWTTLDIVSQFDIDPRKVVTIHNRGAPTELSGSVSGADITRTRRELDLPASFALYPAQTWPHKNHLALLDAVASLRDRHSLIVQLICTGRQNDHWPTIRDRRRVLGLTEQVRFLGYVPPAQLRALYRLAEFVVLPSLFEGGGFPVVEAFVEGAPLACSTATSLPEYADDAALLFEPTVEGIADAMRRLATSAELRRELRRRGIAQGKRYSWEDTARAYRALYRAAADQPTDEPVFG